MTARLDVLCAGYAADRVASTVVLIRDQGAVIVVDPGMVAGRQQILGPLAELGVDPASVSDVVFSHHHPDHTLNAALFERARFHDFWAIYQDDTWTDRPPTGSSCRPRSP
jgi:glyoxylase-like metal-dependent hydrolase (beta-lactamase superfamily II)